MDVDADARSASVECEWFRVEFMDKIMPGGMGIELGEMMEYMSNPGYHGGEAAIKAMDLITPKDVMLSLHHLMRTSVNWLNSWVIY